MSKKEINVDLQTITPLWTGDAWQENTKIRPSSLMGSLRFWFSVYWKSVKNGKTESLNNNDVVADSLKELENPKVNHTLNQILKSHLRNNNDNKSFDEMIDQSLEELGLSVPSRLFGCTGWKSRIAIKIDSYEEIKVKFNELDFIFPFNDSTKFNTEFWIKQNLFQNKNSEIILFKNIKMMIRTTEYWWEKYLYDFFDFYKDKLILIGGKLSFSFGFVNIKVEGDKKEDKRNITDYNNIIRIQKIEKIKYNGQKEVLGYNFKYFLRKSEDKNFRKTFFGEQKIASRIYVSNLLKEDNNSVYLINFNNPFDDNEALVEEKIFNKYKELLSKFTEDRGDLNG